jgi:SET domain-containing protein
VHGKGVFALQPIKPPASCIIEYTGEVITWPEALRRHPHDPARTPTTPSTFTSTTST